MLTIDDVSAIIRAMPRNTMEGRDRHNDVAVHFTRALHERDPEGFPATIFWQDCFEDEEGVDAGAAVVQAAPLEGVVLEGAEADEPTDEERLLAMQDAMEEVVELALLTMRKKNDKISPNACAAEIIGWIAKEMDEYMPPDAVRSGMLIAFCGHHPDRELNFIQINDAKNALVRISAAARKARAAAVGLIVPGT